MNDLLKALSRAMEPFGYRIRPARGVNFLRIPKLENAENNENVRAVSQSLCMNNPEGNMNAIHVFLRTCIRENRNPKAKNIPGGAALDESIQRSIRSLVRSIIHAQKTAPDLVISLLVLDDRSDESKIDMLKNLILPLGESAVLRTTEQAGQGASLHQAFSEGGTMDGLVYFVEDDYLHEEDAIFRMWEFYKAMAEKAGSHMVLYPQEHHAIYNDHYPSYVVIGPDRHWRSVRHATHTFFTHGSVVKKFWRYFENTKFVGDRKKRRKGSEAKTTNRLFDHMPGFSPMRPCAVHFQNAGLLPPLYDWKPLWEKSAG